MTISKSAFTHFDPKSGEHADVKLKQLLGSPIKKMREPLKARIMPITSMVLRGQQKKRAESAQPLCSFR
jgi:hypothetical protein